MFAAALSGYRIDHSGVNPAQGHTTTPTQQLSISRRNLHRLLGFIRADLIATIVLVYPMAAAFDVLRWTWTVSGSSYQDKRYLARPPSSTVLAYRDYRATIRRHQALPNRATSSLHPICRLFSIEITRLGSSNNISQTSRPSISPVQSCGGLSTIRLLPSGSNQPTNSHSGYLIVLCCQNHGYDKGLEREQFRQGTLVVGIRPVRRYGCLQRSPGAVLLRREPCRCSKGKELVSKDPGLHDRDIGSHLGCVRILHSHSRPNFWLAWRSTHLL